ncbi:carbamoyl phosphate synthetase small subunit, glutamine amidotransferase [Desulfamplus magnetovallimortis]|uniref:Carbamoyl phosphate synthase small chain n=1 Tax=Desulfamplus magnetovallimortis TaxID=1246637 RepID=A0A1W1HDV3_9BACT|nr:glutamine-hydrolyzing carbamoyl-phosphate synthase small subunit [Desulfamplus magnetovallimortis]SLM30659.1 carbamoyl phosphate synthetase small subunit, glutamine amidotransferase [Desulfamplus magnetovallimortis]
MKALLALEDGRTFPCRSFTGSGEASGEVVFNTSMTGYQEILTDPSYHGQMVTMTCPMMGNYGVCPEDMESGRIQAAALIVREYVDYPSNWRSTGTLAAFLKKEGILGVEDIDTRALTRHIRNAGAMRAIISTTDLDPSSLVEKAKKLPSMEGSNLAEKVSTDTPYLWRNNQPDYLNNCTLLDDTIWRQRGTKHSVAALDFGIKYNIIRCLEDAGCEVLVLPAATSADVIKSLNPDGIFLSNGPGDPEPLHGPIETIKELLGHRPMFGICLGMQLMGLAMGAKTHKIKFGHRGGNQPVKNFATCKVEITSQNHGFAVDLATLPKSLNEQGAVMTHINLNEESLEGIRNDALKAFAVQYHPEASPGPHDAAYLFTQFAKMMEK